MKLCQHCKNELDIEGRIQRTETCPQCGADLRVCLNCRFHDPDAYNQCRETQAERVVDKDRSNFCEYFVFRDAPTSKGPEDKTPGAKAKLEDLFKK